jgi:hypothetical protein
VDFLHVGMKVADIRASSALFAELFGMTWEPVREYTLQTVTLEVTGTGQRRPRASAISARTGAPDVLPLPSRDVPGLASVSSSCRNTVRASPANCQHLVVVRVDQRIAKLGAVFHRSPCQTGSAQIAASVI